MGLFDIWRRKREESREIRGRMTFPQRAIMTNATMSNSEAIYSAVSRISNTFGMIPIGIYKGYERQRDSIAQLLEHPNDNMTAMEFYRTLEVDRLTTGNGYAMLIRSELGQVLHMVIIDPARVIPQVNTDTGDIWYHADLGPYGQMLLHNTDMIHVRTPSADGIKGIPPTAVLTQTIHYSETISKFSLQALENGVHSGLVIDFPVEISEIKRKKAVDQLLNIYKDSGGALVALDAGVRATRMDGSMIDPKLLDVDKITRLRVAAVYNMPPHMLGDYSSGSSYTSLEQQMLEFVLMTIQPISEIYRQEFNRKLLTTDQRQAGISTKWDLAAIQPLDSNARANMYFKQVRSAGITPNEQRALEGRPPLAGGDELFVSRDMIALKDLGTIGLPNAPRGR